MVVHNVCVCVCVCMCVLWPCGARLWVLWCGGLGRTGVGEVVVVATHTVCVCACVSACVCCGSVVVDCRGWLCGGCRGVMILKIKHTNWKQTFFT